MRTAEEIMLEYVGLNEITQLITRAINEARKETIKECAERAEAWYYYEGDLPEYGVDKQSILSLISELK